jgi:Protein of unknown function (DUF4232)
MQRSWMLGLAGLAVVLAATGCSSSSKGSSSTTASIPGSPTTSAGSPTTSSQGVTTTTSTSASTTPGVPLCGTGQLTASLGAPNGAAGTIYYELAFLNKSSTTCFMQGYPGVSFVAGTSGHQVGAPASRASGSTPKVNLAPGQSADALLGIAEASNFPNCQETPVLGLRVYPPDNTLALYVAHSDNGCANTSVVTLSIHPVAPPG